MFKRKLSIKDKLIAYLVFLSVSAILIVSLVSYIMAKEALMERTFNQLTSVKTVKNRQLNNFFQNRINDIQIVKSTIIKLKNKNENTYLNTHSEDFLMDFLNSNTNIYKNAYLLNETGVHQIMNKKDKATDFYKYIDTFVLKNNQIKIYYTDFIKYGENDYVSFFIGTKLLPKSNSFVFFKISSDVINMMMLENSENNGLGNSGETYLVGEDYLMRSSSKFQNNSILNTKVNTIGVRNIKNGKYGEEIFPDYRGVEVLSSYIKADIPFFNWSLMVELDKKEALAPIKSIRNYILFVTIFISLIVLIIAIMISKNFSKPIISLNKATTEISKGNLEIQLEQTTSDEIGELTLAFNNMTNNLKIKNQQLESEKSLRYSLILDAQEKERERLSRELHDDIGQLFTAIKLNLENTKENDNYKNEAINKSIMFVNDAIDEIRRISNDLMPAILKEFGLVFAIENFLKNLQKYSNINVKSFIDSNINLKDRKKTIYIFRIIQEAANNTIKHANASEVKISIQKKENIVNLNFEDNGKGFNLDEINYGNGLFNIKERVRNMNGKIQIVSKIGFGTSINIEIPD